MSDYKDLNIFQKMEAITNEIGTVNKDLKIEISKAKSYKAVGEKLILEAVKPLEHKYGVYSYPSKRNLEYNEVLTNEKEYNGTHSKSNSTLMRISTVYRFVNVDNPADYIEVDSFGDGIDTGDKAPGKAMTYADKYALMKAYKIETGDDPDQDPSPADPTTELTPEEAKNYVLDFGKHKGKKLSEVADNHPDYIEWLAENGRDNIKEIISIAFPEPENNNTGLVDERTVSIIESLMKETNSDLNELLNYYSVTALSELTAEQANECVAHFNKKRLSK